MRGLFKKISDGGIPSPPVPHFSAQGKTLLSDLAEILILVALTPFGVDDFVHLYRGQISTRVG